MTPSINAPAFNAQPADPAFVCVYAPSGVGKTSDMIASFPNFLFLAAPGALKPGPKLWGWAPVEKRVNDIEEATAEIKALAKNNPRKHDGVVIDDLSFLAEQTLHKWEKRLTGFTLWGKLREIMLAFREACRVEARIHAALNAWRQPPTTKDGMKIRGGPNLSGKLPEQIPAMCDLVLMGDFDPMRRPWGACYRCNLSSDYVMKDRDGGNCPDPAPLNLGEILRAAGYQIQRVLPWQEEVVEHFAQILSQYPQDTDLNNCNYLYQQLLAQNIDPRHAKWTVRDAYDRCVIRRAHAVRWSTFA